MRRVIKSALVAASAFAFLGLASAASASTVVAASCDPVTDGDAAGCLFSGNINSNPNAGNANSYKNAEAKYNTWAASTGNPAIVLNLIASTDDANFSTFGSITGAGMNSGTFSLPGWDLEYFAVKAGNEFILYEYISGNSWTVASGKELSHLVFFGTQGTAVPEPGTWAMMLMGFGAAGTALRRRKRKTTLLQVA